MTYASFTHHDLQDNATVAAFELGQRLIDSVEDDIYEDEFSICATVHDDAGDHLAMIHHEPPLSGECDCPDGHSGLCAHSVAIGLAWLNDSQ